MEAAALEVSDIVLRVIGGFYAFAGYVATRAALTSNLIDQAFAALTVQATAARERHQTLWLFCGAILVLASGAALLLLLDIAVWLFIASALAQAAYLFLAAPRYFDVDDPPDANGRRQTTNAFVLYTAATAYVIWAAYTGKLVNLMDLPWQLPVVTAAAVSGYVLYAIWQFTKPLQRSSASLFGAARGEDGHESRNPATSRRIKVMADYDTHPLWALDDDLCGDFAPEDLGLSTELTADLNAWAEAYTSSLDRETALSRWSEMQHAAHEAAGRPLAIRLARERPDLTVYAFERDTGVVEVHASDPL